MRSARSVLVAEARVAEFARIQSLPTGRAAAFPKSGDFGYDSEPRYRNKNRLGLGEFVLATSAILALAWPCAAKPFVVVDENGRPACQVAQPPEATPAEKTALKMLIEYVGKSTGARLESVERDASKATKPVISLEVSPAWERLKNRRGHGPDGFTVEVQADRVRIIGDNPSSVIYGVASLLERGLGIRWLAPGELWTVVPKRRHVAIPPGTYRETPAFAKRVIHITGVHEHDGVKYPHWHFGSADWAMRNRLNRKFEHVGRTQLRDVMAERGLTPLRGGHAMAFWMPNEPFFAAHPEYYRFDGERRKPLRGGGTQLNYSSVETSALIAQRVLDFLERDPVAETVGVDLNDGYGFSLDRQSRQEWFYDERGMPIVSDSVFGFTNRVAEIVSRRFPDVAIGQLAYTRYYHQPPRFPLHPNVGIRFTLYRGSQTHPMCEARNESDAQMRRELQEWRKLTDKLLIYEYLTGYWGQMMFASGVRMIADDIRWYRKMGFEGAMTEYEPGKPAREMLYVYARLLWNPQQDHADIIRDFYGAAYGKGSEKMLTAYEAYRQANERCGYEGSGAYLAAALTQVEGFRERMARLMQEAEGLAEEAAEKARIQRVRNEFAQFMKQGEPLAGCKLSFDEKPSPEQLLSSANVAPNPSFEDSQPNWTFSPSADFKAQVVEGVAWHGKRSLAIVGPRDRCAGGKARLTLAVPVEKGAWYDVHLMAKPDQAAIDSFSTLYTTISGVEFLRERRSPRVGPALLSAEWRPITFGLCRAASDKITLSPYVLWGAGAWHFDGLSVRKLERK